MATALGHSLWTDLGLKIRVTGPGMSADGTTFELAQPFARVGRFSKSDVRLDNRSVSRWHLFLMRLGGGVYFLDLGSRKGTQRGGTVVPHGWVNSYQPLMVGPYSVYVEDAAPAPAGEPLERIPPAHDDLVQVQLTFHDQRGLVGTYQLGRSLTVLGRSAPSNLRVSDMSVGKAHVALYRTEAGVWLINLIGIGVELRGRSVQADRLEDGSVFQIGELEMQVALQPPRPPATAPRQPQAVPDDAGSDEAMLLDDRLVEPPRARWEEEKFELEQEIERLRADALAMEQLLTELDADKDDNVRRLKAEYERESAALREEMASLHRTNEDLVQRLAHATGALSTAQEESTARLSELTAKLAELVQQRAEEASNNLEERKSLERHLEEARHECAQMHSELAYLRTEASQAQAALQEAENVGQQAQAELAQWRTEMEQQAAREPEPREEGHLADELAEARRVGAELEAQLADARAECTAWHEKSNVQAERAQKEAAALAAALENQEQLRSEIDQQRQQFEQLTARLTDQQRAHLAEIQAQAAQFERLSKEWETLRQELTQQRDQAVAESHRLSKAESEKGAELLRRERQIQTASEELCAAQRRIEELAAQVADLSARTNASEQSRAEQARQQAAAADELADLRRQSEEAQQQFGSLSARVTQLTEANDRLSQRAAAAEQQAAQASQRLAESAAENAAQAERLREADGRYQEQTRRAAAMAAEIEQLRANHAEQQRDFEKTFRRLEAEREAERKRSGELEAELDRRDQAADALRHDGAARAAELATKTQQAAELAQQVAGQSDELARLRDELDKSVRDREALLARRAAEIAELRHRLEFETESNRLERIRHQREVAGLQQRLRESAQAAAQDAAAGHGEEADVTVVQEPKPVPEATTEWNEVAVGVSSHPGPQTIFDEEKTVAEPGLAGEVPTDRFEDLRVLPPVQTQAHLDVAERLIDKYSEMDRRRRLLIQLGWGAVAAAVLVILVLLAWQYFPQLMKSLL